ncbi:unnamed protein product, partial [Gongylonema pulchrum]|uniref:CBFD_NFYB_HMF domain-containing protein n=1 Tax=Gongylonema pulchrum TaxID=637853 RepID=A0A183DEU5_9BILA
YASPNVLDSFPTTHVADGADVNDDKKPGWHYDRPKSLQSFISTACKMNDEHKLKLIIAADLIEQLRGQIKEFTKFSCSAGIGSSKARVKNDEMGKEEKENEVVVSD